MICVIGEYNNFNLLSFFKVSEKEIFKESLMAYYGDDYITKIKNNGEATDLARLIESQFIKNSNGDVIYPDNYGGMYINSDNSLVIQLVKDKYNNNNNNLIYDNYKTILISDEIKIEYVDFSYYELEKNNQIIIDYFMMNNDINNNFVANYIDIYSNRIIVELLHSDEESKKYFTDYILNSNMVVFKKGVRPNLKSTYKAGSKYNYSYTQTNSQGGFFQTSGKCSVGARTKRNGVLGYITAGHCTGRKMGWNLSSITIDNGTYVASSYNQTMDAAFVKIDSGHTLSNNLAYTGYQASFINTTGLNYFTIGTTVGKSGFAGQYGYGVITSTNYSVIDGDEGYYHSSLISANITTVSGDSGCPVFVINGLTLTNGAPLIGIASLGGTGLLGFYKYDTIVSNLGLTKY